MPKLKQSVKQVSTKTGIYLGIALAVLTIGAYSIDWDIILNRWFQPLKLLFVMIFAIYATTKAKKLNVQEFSFRDAFAAYFITVALGMAIFTLVNYTLFDLFDPQAGQYITQMSIEQFKQASEKAGESPEKIEKSIASLKDSDQFSITNQLKGYVFNMALYAVLGVIIALIFKKKKPIIV